MAFCLQSGGHTLNKLQLRAAWRQTLATGILLAASIGGLIWNRQRPADAEQVKIPVAELRSAAAELLVLDQLDARVPARFRGAHGEQLATKVDSSRSDLDGLRLADAKLDRIRRATSRIAHDIASIAERTTSAQAPSESTDAKLDELQRLEQQLAR